MNKSKPSHKLKKLNLLPLLLITIVVLLVTVYLNRGLFADKTEVLLPTVSNNSALKSNPTLSWEKYQGFGFTFEYPAGWKVKEINSWTDHEYNIYDPTSEYEQNYKGVAKMLFYSRSWNIMVFSENERRNYLENDKLLSPAEYAKFYCETVKSTGTLITSPSPQNGKDAFQAKCFTVADEYLIYNNNFFATVLFRAYGGKEADDETTSRFLSSIKISQ